MMRDGYVDDIDVRMPQQLRRIGLKVADAGNGSKPFEGLGIDVADSDQFRTDIRVEEREPAPERTGHLTAHEAGTDDGDADG
jgi:hypothetical protein